MELRYNSYSSFFKSHYGTRLQKLAIDAGFSCPNRSEDRSRGGCIFCNNAAFNPSYCSPEKSITQQLEEGIDFHRRRYRNSTGYLAYFQPYSNTYADIYTLRTRYEEALSHPLVKGIIIGTRPDCIDEEKLEYIASLAEGGKRFVAIEYGIESCYDKTLERIGRGHDFAATQRAIELTARFGIHCGGHLILGLPGETQEMMINEMAIINKLPINTLKFHQLQIIKGTQLAEKEYCDIKCFEMQEYIRNHGILDSDIHHRLYQWVNNGNSVHDNPWGIRDPKRGLPCDYLEAMEIFYNR